MKKKIDNLDKCVNLLINSPKLKVKNIVQNSHYLKTRKDKYCGNEENVFVPNFLRDKGILIPGFNFNGNVPEEISPTNIEDIDKDFLKVDSQLNRILDNLTLFYNECYDRLQNENTSNQEKQIQNENLNNVFLKKINRDIFILNGDKNKELEKRVRLCQQFYNVDNYLDLYPQKIISDWNKSKFPEKEPIKYRLPSKESEKGDSLMQIHRMLDLFKKENEDFVLSIIYAFSRHIKKQLFGGLEQTGFYKIFEDKPVIKKKEELKKKQIEAIKSEEGLKLPITHVLTYITSEIVNKNYVVCAANYASKISKLKRKYDADPVKFERYHSKDIIDEVQNYTDWNKIFKFYSLDSKAVLVLKNLVCICLEQLEFISEPLDRTEEEGSLLGYNQVRIEEGTVDLLNQISSYTPPIPMIVPPIDWQDTSITQSGPEVQYHFHSHPIINEIEEDDLKKIESGELNKKKKKDQTLSPLKEEGKHGTDSNIIKGGFVSNKYETFQAVSGSEILASTKIENEALKTINYLQATPYYIHQKMLEDIENNFVDYLKIFMGEKSFNKIFIKDNTNKYFIINGKSFVAKEVKQVKEILEAQEEKNLENLRKIKHESELLYKKSLNCFLEFYYTYLICALFSERFIFFPVYFDFRGRIYYNSYAISPQGGKFSRAVLVEFSEADRQIR